MIISIVVVITLIVAAMSFMSGTFSTLPGATNEYKQEYTYIIYEAPNGQVCAKNGTTGTIDYATTSFSRTFNDVVQHIQANGKISIAPDVYLVDHQLKIYKTLGVLNTPDWWNASAVHDIIIDGQGATLVADYVGSEQSTLNSGGFYDNCLIGLGGSDNILIENLKLDGMNISGITGISGGYSGENIEGLTIRNCEVRDFNFINQTAAPFFEIVNGRGIHLMNAEECSVLDTTTSGNTIGITVHGESGPYTGQTNNLIQGCRSIDDNFIGIYVFKSAGTRILDNSITGASNLTGQPGLGSAGIWLGEGAASDRDYVISRNTVTYCYTGIGLMGNGYSLLCNDNVVKYNDAVGIMATNVTVISNNIILDNGRDTAGDNSTRAGVAFGNGSSFLYTLVSGNLIGNLGPTMSQIFGIYDGRASSGTKVYQGNEFIPGAGVTAVYEPFNPLGTADGTYLNNFGYRSWHYGNVTMGSGTNSVPVTHQLDGTPTFISVTGSSVEVSQLWVTNIDSLFFTIHSNCTTTGDRLIYWYATTQEHLV